MPEGRTVTFRGRRSRGLSKGVVVVVWLLGGVWGGRMGKRLFGGWWKGKYNLF